MKMSKLKIRSLFGIQAIEIGEKSVELSGKNGTGKTSVIDAIRYALTNKSDREYVVRTGETEGEVIIETDTGIRIDRKARTNQADYKSIKRNGAEVGSPETFLKDIFTPLQLSPVEFMEMDKKAQNAIILDMIEYPWNLQKIREWFGEIPDWINYDQNILQVLNDIQSESGYYFTHRQDVNRDIRNKKAFVEEIAANIPSGYDAEKWECESLNIIYTEIERIRKDNETIEKAVQLAENRNNKVRKFEADREIAIAALEREIDTRSGQITREIDNFKALIKALETEQAGLVTKKADKLTIIEQTYKADVSKYDAEIEDYKQYVGKEIKSTAALQEKAKLTEDMKKHINEYRRMVGLQNEVEELVANAQNLTSKIEKARTLPGEILETATIPIKGLTVVNGIPLINGLPVSNLSEGEKLDLCIDVAIQKPNGLQIILIDGVEKLSTENREKLYQKCKDKGLQFVATRTTDDEELTVVEL